MSENHHSVVIIGSGIAGLSAAIYAGRAGNNPLVIKGGEPGGQLTLTTDVANYPGFPEGISGPELIQRMTEQAEQFGTKFQNAIVEHVDDSDRPFDIHLRNNDVLTADAVIVASGASARTLGVPGEDELMGYGVSTCATCDGAFFRDEEMVVVGGGDAALEEATFLTKFASKVYLVHRRDEFRAEQIWQDTVQEKVESGDIELVLNSEVVEIEGSQDEGVERVRLVTNPDGKPTEKLDEEETEEWTLDVSAFFVAIGHTPNTEFLTETGVMLDDAGYLTTLPTDGGNETETGVPGLFGAGDVVDDHYQQAATASGMGVKAALDVDAYLD
jgi:thioredoxin reductase (NADPH)